MNKDFAIPVLSEHNSPNNGIQELSFDEIDMVDGAAIPIIVAYYSIGIAVTFLVSGAGFVAAAQLGYFANRR